MQIQWLNGLGTAVISALQLLMLSLLWGKEFVFQTCHADT